MTHVPHGFALSAISMAGEGWGQGDGSWGGFLHGFDQDEGAVMGKTGEREREEQQIIEDIGMGQYL